MKDGRVKPWFRFGVKLKTIDKNLKMPFLWTETNVKYFNSRNPFR